MQHVRLRGDLTVDIEDERETGGRRELWGLTKRSGDNLGNPVISNLRSIHELLPGYI